MPRAITKKEFQQKINEKYPDEKILILDYTKSGAKGSYKCLTCGHIETIYKMGDLMRKKHCCNNCFIYSKKGQGTRTLKHKEEALSLCNASSEIEFIRFDYNNKIFKPTITFKCLKCGKECTKQVIQFLETQACPSCGKNGHYRDTNGFKSLLPEGYELLEEYVDNETPILIRHKCGFIWKTRPHNIRSGTGCPKCAKKRSKGELQIIDFLTRNNIVFEPEKKFEWAGLRRFDFYLPVYNLVIEYHGEQHYNEVEFFRRSLAEVQENDALKKKMALEHGLEYFEICYKNFHNIEPILAQRLSLDRE